MPRNTSVTIGEHLSNFIDQKITEGRFESTSEAVRAGLRLLEEDETKLAAIRDKLSKGEEQINQGQFLDGEKFMQELLKRRA
ncbi:MAG: antitoxin ParD1/3/4 [Parasphingorhabdus sp.]|jgi:antitoxin ParD1/3/4